MERSGMITYPQGAGSFLPPVSVAHSTSVEHPRQQQGRSEPKMGRPNYATTQLRTIHPICPFSPLPSCVQSHPICAECNLNLALSTLSISDCPSEITPAVKTTPNHSSMIWGSLLHALNHDLLAV
ncbi:hypothetical protein Adt_21882 [Abeliophyllum distichum]|uniref:Uncharacterized protein n=1 Tax=Abeliophyllum distichum TaxID=126358 RepID=A0ABD1T0V3_9LAMI